MCVFLLSQKKKQGPLHITVGELLRLSKECPYSNVPFGLAVVVSLFLSALHVVVNLSVLYSLFLFFLLLVSPAGTGSLSVVLS